MYFSKIFEDTILEKYRGFIEREVFSSHSLSPKKGKQLNFGKTLGDDLSLMRLFDISHKTASPGDGYFM